MARSKVLVSLSMRHGVCESIVAIQMRANEHALTFVPPTSLWENASQADASRIHVGMIRKGYAAETLKEQEKRATMQKYWNREEKRATLATLVFGTTPPLPQEEGTSDLCNIPVHDLPLYN